MISLGSVVLEGYKSITRIMLNPSVAECIEFKNRFVHYLDSFTSYVYRLILYLFSLRVIHCLHGK